MSTIATTSIFILAFIGLIALPLVPSCRELLYKTDQNPLNVVPQHTGDIRVFADGLRRYLAPIKQELEDSNSQEADVSVVMPDGNLCLFVAHKSSSLDLELDDNRTCTKLIFARGVLVLPSSITFARDIFAQGAIWGGEGNQYRAVLGESDVHLAVDSIVMRWIHAGGEIDAAPQCVLYGRVSSDRSIRLQPGCRFTRLNAPRIDIGEHRHAGLASQFKDKISATANEIADRILHDGDFEVAPGELLTKHLVVRGKLHIGAGARLLGNVKAQKCVVLDPGVITHGSLISSTTVNIGPDCRLRGPVIAERTITIGERTQIGSAGSLTAVSAPKIEIAEGAVVFGTMWAREQGRVVVHA